MKFSEHFNCELDDSDDWFDLLLNVDTKLFIDPFLIYSGEYADFIGSNSKIVSLFNTVFQFIARSEGNEASILWKKTLGLLLFPEAEEFKLGYTGKGKPGAGSGQGFSKIIVGALWESVEAGVEEITHFEQVGILREGIGTDRISDITATILRQRFVTTYFGHLKQDIFQIYLWKLSFEDGGDECVARMAMDGDKVAGIWIT